MTKQANNQKTVASKLGQPTLNVTVENTSQGMKIKENHSKTKPQKNVSSVAVATQIDKTQEILNTHIQVASCVESATFVMRAEEVSVVNTTSEIGDISESLAPVEVFNFKGEKKLVNITKLIQANKTLDLETMLKTQSINPNQRDVIGATCSWTPLYWSVKLNKIECVEILLNNGADVNMVVNDPLECYGTALDLATLLGHEEIESVIRKHMNKESEIRPAFKAVRTKLRGNAPAFNFKSQKRQEAEMAEIEQARRDKKEQLAA